MTTRKSFVITLAIRVQRESRIAREEPGIATQLYRTTSERNAFPSALLVDLGTGIKMMAKGLTPMLKWCMTPTDTLHPHVVSFFIGRPIFDSGKTEPEVRRTNGALIIPDLEDTRTYYPYATKREIVSAVQLTIDHDESINRVREQNSDCIVTMAVKSVYGGLKDVSLDACQPVSDNQSGNVR